MNGPTISGIFTINERPREVLSKVFASLPENEIDQWVICFDRTPADLQDWVRSYWNKRLEKRIDFLRVDGEPGPKGAIVPFNKAFDAVECEVAYVFSSEVIHAPDNIENTRKLMSGMPCVLFGACRDSGECGGQTEGGDDSLLLCDSTNPRPLGFIMAIPTWALRVTGGYHLPYEDGYWYADDDFAATLFSLGLPFVFDDSVSGVHQAHPRPQLQTPEGQAKIKRNETIYLERWGRLKAWENMPKMWANEGKRTVCVPQEFSGLVSAWESLC